MRTWMIRHHDFSFARPMSEKDLVEKIESGEITAHDEIAQATGYWFSIQDVEEVKKHFGNQIRLQALIPPSSTDTTSSTNTALLTSIPKVSTQVRAPKKDIPFETSEPTRSNLVFGLILTAIFVGTIVLLWLGSQ
jgi:hypothetical protein